MQQHLPSDEEKVDIGSCGSRSAENGAGYGCMYAEIGFPQILSMRPKDDQFKLEIVCKLFERLGGLFGGSKSRMRDMLVRRIDNPTQDLIQRTSLKVTSIFKIQV